MQEVPVVGRFELLKPNWGHCELLNLLLAMVDGNASCLLSTQTRSSSCLAFRFLFKFSTLNICSTSDFSQPAMLCNPLITALYRSTTSSWRGEFSRLAHQLELESLPGERKTNCDVSTCEDAKGGGKFSNNFTQKCK